MLWFRCARISLSAFQCTSQQKEGPSSRSLMTTQSSKRFAFNLSISTTDSCVVAVIRTVQLNKCALCHSRWSRVDFFVSFHSRHSLRFFTSINISRIMLMDWKKKVGLLLLLLFLFSCSPPSKNDLSAVLFRFFSSFFVVSGQSARSGCDGAWLFRWMQNEVTVNPR